MAVNPVENARSTRKKGASWSELFGDNFRPKLHARLLADGDHLSVLWSDPQGFGDKVCAVLRKDAEADGARIWTDEEWRETVLGDPPAQRWVRRLLLLCRGQRSPGGSELSREDRNRFLMLPDGLVVSAKLLSPPNQQPGKRRNVLVRIPESVVLVALDELLADDSQLARDGWNDSDLASSFVTWLRENGACFGASGDARALSVTQANISNLRNSLKALRGWANLPAGVGRFFESDEIKRRRVPTEISHE